MVPVDNLLAFAVMSVVLIVIPGPSVLFVVGRALAHGRRTALTTVLGNAAGAYVVVVAVALGVGAVVERSVAAFTVLKLAGAAYLVYLGLQALRHRNQLHTALVAGRGMRSGVRTFWDGFVVGVTNPKSVVFFAAVLPQFVDPGGHVGLQMLVLGLVFTAIALVSDAAWGLTAATARGWFARSPRRLSGVGAAGGLAMVGLGVTLATSGRTD